MIFTTYFKKLVFVLSLFLITSFSQEGKLSVYLIGDSTIAIKQVSAYPETGWGMPFAYFFDDSVTVVNAAMNGRSTRTFIEENRWQPIADKLQQGDYVLIQFGHNDEVKTKKSYTTETEFQANLQKFIDESQAKKAIPILITPVARRSFDASGKIVDTHAAYSELVRAVANKNHLPYIDLDKLSQELLQKMGPENSKFLFLHLEPDEHPNYPAGKEDNTHFSEFGARKMAELVLSDLKRQKIDLTLRVRKSK